MFKLQFKENPNRSIWLVGDTIRLGSDKGNDLVLDGLGIDDFHVSSDGSCLSTVQEVNICLQLGHDDCPLNQVMSVEVAFPTVVLRS